MGGSMIVKTWMWVVLTISVFCNGASLWLYFEAVTNLRTRVTQLEEIAAYHVEMMNKLTGNRIFYNVIHGGTSEVEPPVPAPKNVTQNPDPYLEVVGR
jgi:hypothetical protein